MNLFSSSSQEKKNSPNSLLTYFVTDLPGQSHRQLTSDRIPSSGIIITTKLVINTCSVVVDQPLLGSLATARRSVQHLGQGEGLQGSFPPFNKETSFFWGLFCLAKNWEQSHISLQVKAFSLSTTTAATGLTAARVDALYCTGEQAERPAVYSGPKYTGLVLYPSRWHEGAIDVLYSKQVCIDIPHYAAAWYWSWYWYTTVGRSFAVMS